MVIKHHENVAGLEVFTLNGDVEKITKGYVFSYEGMQYQVESVAMINGEINRNEIDVVVKMIDK